MAGELSHQQHRNAGFGRRARSRGNHDRVRRKRARICNIDAIVPPHGYLCTELAQVLNEVVSE